MEYNTISVCLCTKITSKTFVKYFMTKIIIYIYWYVYVYKVPKYETLA